MKIIHIWDQAGVSCIFAKYQQEKGVSSKVIRIINEKYPDKYGIYDYYREYIIKANSEEDFIKKCLKETEDADIIHVHSAVGMVIRLRMKYGIKKKIFLEYLGTDIRGLDRDKHGNNINNNKLIFMLINIARKKFKEISKKEILHVLTQILSDYVIVATPDLLDYVYTKRKTYIPIPVDTDLFKIEIKKKSIGTKKALSFNTEVSNMSRTQDLLKSNNIELDFEIYDRTMKPILYKDMPNFLKNYNIYVDIRFINDLLLKNYSSTAFQALSCGLKVLDFKLSYTDEFPKQNDPENINYELMRIYSKKSNRSVMLILFFIKLIKNFKRNF